MDVINNVSATTNAARQSTSVNTTANQPSNARPNRNANTTNQNGNQNANANPANVSIAAQQTQRVSAPQNAGNSQRAGADGRGHGAESATYQTETRQTIREEEITDNMLREAFSDANRALAGGQFRLSYGVHEGTGRITVAVLNPDSDEVIREVPSESRLDLYARITEFTGLLFDRES
jgi:flagellar protein FlaG